MGAVIGTFAAFAGTLAAYKFFNIKVSGKFRMFVTAAVFGMIGLAVLEMVLSLFGAQIGLFGVSGLGMVTAFAGLILGVFMLIMDFDFRSEEHTSELQSLMRISYAVFCLKKKNKQDTTTNYHNQTH